MIDTAALTGESVPRRAVAGDEIISGCVNGSGTLKVRTTKEFDDSTVAKILELVENASSKKSKTENFITRFAKYYTPVVTIGAVILAVLPPLILGGGWGDWIQRACIFLVISCPCALVISVPLGFFGGIGAASKIGVLVKGSNYLEAVAEMTTIVFDKTGTLTKGEFKVSELKPANCTEAELLELAALGEGYSTHPIANSIKEAYAQNIDMNRVSDAEEEAGHGVNVKIDGQEVLIGNEKLMKAHQVEYVPCESAGTIVYVAKYMNKQGFYYQPVSDIGTAVHIAVDGEYAGYILISDIIRPGVKKMVRWLDRHQIESVMLTGDNDRVAEDVAKKVGIHSVFSNLMPEDKVEQLEDFMESRIEEEKLAFVGDGINDAPVLARADIGIAMGGLGADAALEAADIILMEDEPIKIVNAIRISKGTIRAVKQNMIFAIGMKVYLLVLALFGYVSMENAIIADVGVMLLNILNSFWILKYPE